MIKKLFHKIKTYLLVTELVLLIFLIGRMIIPNHRIDPELSKYYDHYMLAVLANCDHNEYNEPNRTNIHFGNLESPEIGECIRTLIDYEIIIDKTTWSNLNDAEKLQLMFHELTHCIIYKDHTTDPGNYMYESLRPLTINEVLHQTWDNIFEFCHQ